MENFILYDVSDINIDNVMQIFNSNEEFLLGNLDRPLIDRNFVINEICNMSNLGFITYILTDLNGKEIGMCEYKIGYDVYISLLIVNKDFQNRGIGSQIYKLLESKFKSQGVQKISLEILEDGDRSKDFWTKLGFVLDEKTILEWDDKKIKAFRMIKDLSIKS